MNTTITRVINTLESVTVSGRENMWNMMLCLNTLREIEKTGKKDSLQSVVDVLNSIPVSGKRNISFLCGCIDELNKLIAEDSEGGEADDGHDEQGQNVHD